MKPEDIKVGETYYVRVKAERNEVDGAFFQLIDENGHGDKGYRFYSCCYYAFLPTPTPPKYDPRRLFKKGDKVRVVDWNGRKLNRVDMPDLLEVEIDEHIGDNDVSVFWQGSKHWGKCHIQQCYLELVTPVEERSPYYVKETASVYEVFNRNENNSSVAIFFKSQYSIEKAKERAEAERDRLNAEYRKEQNND